MRDKPIRRPGFRSDRRRGHRARLLALTRKYQRQAKARTKTESGNAPRG